METIVRKNGFTLIELLVVVGVMTVIGVIGADLLMTIFKSSNKASITTQVRQNGTYAVDVIERTLRNGTKLYKSVSGGTGVEFISADNDNCQNSLIVQTGQAAVIYTQFSFVVEGESNGFIAQKQTSVLANLESYLPGASDSLTNTDGFSGVSVLADPVPCFKLTTTSGKPQVVTIQFSLRQGKNAPSRQDYQTISSFETTVSLRNY